MDIVTYALLKNKITSIVSGFKGASVDPNDETRVILHFANDVDVPVKFPGITSNSFYVNSSNHLIVNLGPLGLRDLGYVKGEKGDKGDSFTFEDFTEEQLESLKGKDGDTTFGLPTNEIKIKDFLSEFHYNDIDYNYAKKYFDEHENDWNFACSSLRNGNYYGRNFDWYYDNTPEFIVHTPRIGKRYASIGVASQKVNSEMDKKLIPFKMVDGINECGVIVNINVVPNQKRSNATKALIQTKEQISPLMMVRYILDNFDTAKNAVEYIRDYVDISLSNALSLSDYDCHFMVADENKTFLLELIGSRVVVTEMTAGCNSLLDGKPYMTNFLLKDVRFNINGTVTAPAEGDPTEINNITSLGSGLERYNIIVNNYSSTNTKNGMRNVLNSLNFTNAYDMERDDIWYSEFVSEGKPLGTDVSEYNKSTIEDLFESRDRDTSLTWQTVHSSIYDIENKKLYIIVQEDEEELEFKLEKQLTPLNGGSGGSQIIGITYEEI